VSDHPHDDHDHHDRGHDGHDHGHHDDHEHDHDAPTGLVGRLRHLVAPHSHDAAVSMDSELETSRRGMRALLLSFVALSITAALQAVVYLLSGSVALLVDTLHNVADALTALPIAVAFTLGRRTATRRYTYGYGRAEDLAGIVVVVVIAVSAVLAAYEAIRRLADPQELDHLGLVALAGSSASSATSWWRATGSRWVARSARPHWWPTGCTPAPTASRRWGSSSAPLWPGPGSSGPTRSSAWPSRSPSSPSCATPPGTSTAA
jgi:hypothetical protein